MSLSMQEDLVHFWKQAKPTMWHTLCLTQAKKKFNTKRLVWTLDRAKSIPQKLYALGPSPPSPTSAQSGPCPISCLHCNEWLEGTSGTYGASRNRFRVEFGKLGRNIRQRLLHGYFSKDGIRKLSSINVQGDSIFYSAVSSSANTLCGHCWKP